MSSDDMSEVEAITADGSDFLYPVRVEGVGGNTAIQRAIRRGREVVVQAKQKVKNTYQTHGTKNPVNAVEMKNAAPDWRALEIDSWEKELFPHPLSPVPPLKAVAKEVKHGIRELKRHYKELDYYGSTTANELIGLHLQEKIKPAVKKETLKKLLRAYYEASKLSLAKTLIISSVLPPSSPATVIDEHGPRVTQSIDASEPTEYVRKSYRHPRKRLNSQTHRRGLPPEDLERLSHAESYLKELEENGLKVVMTDIRR